MKVRIISAICGIVLFLGILLLSTDIVLSSGYPIILTLAVALLSGIGTYEILHNTKIVKNNIIAGISCAAAFLLVLAFSLYGLTLGVMAYFFYLAVLLTVSLFVHDKTSYAELAAAQAYVMFLSYSFYCVDNLISQKGLFSFLLVFIFAWGSDTFAYFTGVFLGKHKLCPSLSPKKTVEGAIGGIVGAAALTAVACIICNANGGQVNAVLLTVISPVFSVLGMVGDISASYIKRAAGIKDYGNLMPGHGGVLDRFDSVLLIAPVFHAVLYLLPLINS